jgi:hypothetical protein
LVQGSAFKLQICSVEGWGFRMAYVVPM